MPGSSVGDQLKV